MMLKAAILIMLSSMLVLATNGQHSTEEILAQGMCQAMAAERSLWGTVYAVGKYCNDSVQSDSCDSICGSTTLHNRDSQTANYRWECIGAFHVYNYRPATERRGRASTATLGLKSVLASCGNRACGPNFCCCIANRQ